MTFRMKEQITTYLRELRKKPLKIVLAVAVLFSMLAITFFAWDGIPKRLIICLGLSVLSGIFLLLPRLPNRVTIPLLLLYLYYVPLKIFQRMELPVHDMSVLADGATQLTVAFIIGAFLLLFVCTQNSAIALSAGSGFFLILFLVEYYIWKFRGNFLMPSDFRAISTAMTVIGGYQYDMSPEALYSVIYLIFFIVWGSRIRIRMRKWVHVLLSAIAVLFVGGWYYVVMLTQNPLGKEFVINYWNIKTTQNLNGACLSYFLLWKDSRIDVPNTYSEEELLRIATDTTAMYQNQTPLETDAKPNIIMIMSEAWSDLRVLGELDTTEEYTPFVDSLTKNTIKGEMHVSILGGLTANTEFEALTGGSLSLLAPAVIPFQNQVQHDVPSLARILKAQGYETIAVHPNTDIAWGRDKVYPHFGFDDFIHQGNWDVPFDYVRGFISDECSFKEIICRYEMRDKNSPFFLFNVTIQNHGGYGGGVPLDINITRIGQTQAEDLGDATELLTYLNMIKISDNAFCELIQYFEQVDEPVIICLFGDHQPLLEDDFYDIFFEGQELSEQERNFQKYIVPYVIWANYDVDWKEYGDISANYIPSILMECAGLQLPPFYQYLMKLYEEYPVLTKIGCVNKEQNLMDIADIWDTEWIRQYRMFQYGQLYVTDYKKEIFEETGKLAP